MMSAPGFASAGERFYVGAGLGQSRAGDLADAEDPFGSGSSFPLTSMSVDGFEFDGEETAWGALLGWKAKDWLAIELGYHDLGNFGASIGFRAIGAPESTLSLDIEEWSLGARFSVPVSRDFAANWFVGASRVDFEADGRFAISTGLPLFGPGSTEIIVLPFASPDDETGLVWGFGFTWRASERIELDLGYRRHDTRVLEIDAVSLDLLFSL